MIILATKSLTRIQLLANAGIDFKTETARIDEREIESSAARSTFDQQNLTQNLADAKAKDVSSRHPQAVVVGADQTLSINDSYLHKPANFDALRDQLQLLRGKTHILCAAVSVCRDGEVLWGQQSNAKMTMREFSDAEADHVIKLEGDKLLKSVGGYRLEGPSIQLFERIDGDYFTILGLPLLPLLTALRNLKAI